MSQAEIETIRKTFEQRRHVQGGKYKVFSPFQYFSRVEREYWMGHYMLSHFGSLDNIKFLEIGAGIGANLHGVVGLGLDKENIFANELVPDFSKALEKVLPANRIFPGDAREIPGDLRFDVVFQATVFTSILNPELRTSVANHLWSLVRPGGMFIWYDFVYNNPRNPNVRGLSLSEVRRLFPEAEIQSRRITLAPPIGRRVGRYYNAFNLPFLRSHILAVLTKPVM